MATQTVLPTTGRWLALAQLVRLPNVFTAMADILLGALACAALPNQTIPFAFALLASCCLYMAGMVWNDFFDQEQDRRERPFRPLPSGKIGPATAVALGIGLLVAGLFCAYDADPAQCRVLVVALLLVPAIFLYDAWLKRIWLGPIGMGACRFLNVMLGLSIASGEVAAWGWILALSVGVYITGVTWFARTEAQMSKQNVLLAAAGVMLAGLVLGLAVPALARDAERTRASPLFPYLLVGYGFCLALPLMRAIRNPSPPRVQAAVKQAVLGLILLDAVLATALVGIVGLLIAALLVPAVYLGRWVYST
jgi:4-hydroxybenzoate polyprenyltransferase